MAVQDDGQYVTLGIDREVFAVPVDAVIEILDMREIFRLPEAPVYLAGLIDVRGRAVPVIDLRTKLGLPKAETTPSTRILVLEVPVAERRLVLGLITDRVFEVTSLGEQEVEPAPDIGLTWRSDYIKGVGRNDDGFVIVFDLARLFSADEAAYLGAKAASRGTPAADLAAQTSPVAHGTPSDAF